MVVVHVLCVHGLTDDRLIHSVYAGHVDPFRTLARITLKFLDEISCLITPPHLPSTAGTFKLCLCPRVDRRHQLLDVCRERVLH